MRRACGYLIDIEWRDVDDLSLRLGTGEPDDLAGEISYNSDDSRMRPTDFHKGCSGEGANDVGRLAHDAGCEL